MSPALLSHKKNVKMAIYQNILRTTKKKLALLVDPDKAPQETLSNLCRDAQLHDIDLILTGGSLLWHSIQQTVATIKQSCQIPVVLFPGHSCQVAANADGILFISLISGRNPDFLIGQHVISAPNIKQSGLEVIPTGYILIETGTTTAVEYMSNTRPIPANKPDILCATALAGEMLGLQMLYLEGGSGADNAISPKLIAAVRETVSIPLMVGGGIRTAQSLHDAYSAGADIAVIGTAVEHDPESIRLFAQVKYDFNRK